MELTGRCFDEPFPTIQRLPYLTQQCGATQCLIRAQKRLSRTPAVANGPHMPQTLQVQKGRNDQQSRWRPHQQHTRTNEYGCAQEHLPRSPQIRSVIQANWTVAIGGSPIATVACVDAWIEDFRKDIHRNDLPTMIIHGDDDRILPADVTSRRQVKMIKNVRFIEIKGGSHGLPWTHAEEINTELVKFLA